MSTSPAPSTDSWAQDDNPRHYDAFAREYPNYSQTSRDLIAHAQPAPDAVAVDLACGTGITTREILAVLGPHGTVTGVDKSAAMLEVAASSVSDPRATWIQARAETVDQHVPRPADVVICNSAIWQSNTSRPSPIKTRPSPSAPGCRSRSSRRTRYPACPTSSACNCWTRPTSASAPARPSKSSGSSSPPVSCKSIGREKALRGS